MSVIAEFRLASPEIALVGTLRSTPEMSVEVEQAIAEDPDEPVLFIWARGGDFDLFDRALAEDDAIAEHEVIESLNDKRLYRIRISGSTNIGLYRLNVEIESSRLDVRVTHEGVEARMRFADQQALQEYFARCRAQGVEVSLQRLYHDRTGEEATEKYGLSPKQLRTLEVAYREGFFEIPRRASLSDLARELDISEQAVSERIRRATTKLIGNTIAPGDVEHRRE